MSSQLRRRGFNDRRSVIAGWFLPCQVSKICALRGHTGPSDPFKPCGFHAIHPVGKQRRQVSGFCSIRLHIVEFPGFGVRTPDKFPASLTNGAVSKQESAERLMPLAFRKIRNIDLLAPVRDFVGDGAVSTAVVMPDFVHCRGHVKGSSTPRRPPGR